MKKSLLALAVLGAFAGAAAAQTNVTMYGIADAGIGFTDTDKAGADGIARVVSGTQSASRFGIRGSEDLGGGLKAVFNIEATVNWDDGSNNAAFWQRRAVVGVAGGWGQVLLGRDYTPAFTAGGVGDVMGYSLYGNWLNFTLPNAGIDTRASNGLHYTGSFGGVTLRAMYATGEQDGTGLTTATPPAAIAKGTDDVMGLSAVYAAGPLSVAGYYQVRDLDGTNDLSQYGIGGQYNFGMFRVGVNYGVSDSDQTNLKYEGMGVGVGLKIGSGEILAQYIKTDTDVANGETDVIGVAYVHPLSKRTNLYASYGQRDNESAVGHALYAVGHSLGGNANAADTTGNGTAPKAFTVGVRHMF